MVNFKICFELLLDLLVDWMRCLMERGALGVIPGFGYLTWATGYAISRVG